jgi:hypothetical protein
MSVTRLRELVTSWRDKHGDPNGAPYEQGQWDMAQRVLGSLREEGYSMRPITEAPRDRTVLGWGPHIGFSLVYWDRHGDQFQKVDLGSPYRFGKDAVTHFTLLPEKPEL